MATGVAGVLPGCAAAAGAQRAAATSASDPVHIKLSEEAGTPLKMRFLGTGAADWNGRDERGELRRLSSVLLDSKVLIDFTPTDEDMIPAGVKPEVIFYTHSHGDHYNPKAALKLGIKSVFLGATWVERAKCPKAVPASGLFWSSIVPFMVVFLNNIQITYRINVIDPFKR